MRSFATIVAILPVVLAAVTERQLHPAPCPANYPVRINDTSFGSTVFSLQVRANNPAYDGHSVQLRNSTTGVQTVVVDNASPVLKAQLLNGIIYSEGRTLENANYHLGPTGRLVNTTSLGNAQRQRFTFESVNGYANATQNGTYAYGRRGGEVNSRNGFYLESLSDDGTYGLYHNVPTETSNGFLICPVGSYHQLFYYTYHSTPGNLSNCESIGLQTTIAPVILNGNCTI